MHKSMAGSEKGNVTQQYNSQIKRRQIEVGLHRYNKLLNSSMKQTRCILLASVACRSCFSDFLSLSFALSGIPLVANSTVQPKCYQRRCVKLLLLTFKCVELNRSTNYYNKRWVRLNRSLYIKTLKKWIPF